MSASEPPRFDVRLRSRRVQKELNALHEPDYRRVIALLRALGQSPRPPGCEKLYDDVFRVRAGSWRAIYLVDQASGRTGALKTYSPRLAILLAEAVTRRFLILYGRPASFCMPA